MLGIPDAGLVAQSLGRDAAQILSPPISASTSVAQVKDKDIVLVDVPEGADKPYTFGRQVFIRRGDLTEKADVKGLRALFNSMPRFEVRWERRLAAGAQQSDLEASEINSVAASAQNLFGVAFPPDGGANIKLESNGRPSGRIHTSIEVDDPTLYTDILSVTL